MSLKDIDQRAWVTSKLPDGHDWEDVQRADSFMYYCRCKECGVIADFYMYKENRPRGIPPIHKWIKCVAGDTVSIGLPVPSCEEGKMHEALI